MLAEPSCSTVAPSAIPTISLAPFFTGSAEQRQRLACEWGNAMASLGMVTVTEHGVSAEAVDALYGSALGFFRQPHEVKMRACLRQGYGKGGYVPQGVEAVARSTGAAAAAADVVESLVFSHGGGDAERMMPDDPAALRPAVQGYWAQLEALLRVLMRLSALALGLAEDHFDPPFTPPKCNLRLAYYPPVPSSPEHRPAGERYGAHTDYTGFTILRVDGASDGDGVSGGSVSGDGGSRDGLSGGLEAQLPDGTWISVGATEEKQALLTLATMATHPVSAIASLKRMAA